MRESAIESKFTKWMKQQRRLDNTVGLLCKDEIGIPDRLGIWNGRAVGIEFKTEKGKQRPGQILFQKKWEKCGGIYILARSIEEVEKELELL